MLAEERQNKIVEQVNEKGSVLVKDLSRQFSVTEDSIRKDLTLLQNKGLLHKTYGGAVKVKTNEHDLFVSQRREKNLEGKIKIAEKAEVLIQDGDMVFLDVSTANAELAKLLAQKDRPVTVVSNMVDVMLAFCGNDRVKFTFIGGNFNAGKDGFVGALTNQELENYQFDKAFLGVVGVDLAQNRVSTYDNVDATTKKTILSHSRDSYMMLETRKLSEEGNFSFACIDDFTGAVMEDSVPPEQRKSMDKYAIDWL